MASPELLPRAAGPMLERLIDMSPVVVVLGARQTGKTTLVRSLPRLADHRYVTLDDFDARAQADSDPELMVERAPRMVFDEIQRTPDLLIAVKRAVDADRSTGRFVVTGSANLLMMDRVGETLAGRSTYLTLRPMTRRELDGQGTTGCWSDIVANPASAWVGVLEDDRPSRADWQQVAMRGGLPVPAHDLSDPDTRQLWLAGYVQTYLERDLHQVRAVENLADFRRLMRAAAHRVGGLLNQTDLGRDVGISQPQAHRFLNVLDASYLTVRVEAFAVNRTKRLTKSPKLYWCDTALAMHLAGESAPRGEHLENLIVADLLAWRELHAQRPEILHWRTTSGQEVDFVIESPNRLVPIEVKSSRRVGPSEAKGIEAFAAEYPELTDGGLVLYDGDEAYQLTRNSYAVPWWYVV
jgi:uncharacterized protein